MHFLLLKTTEISYICGKLTEYVKLNFCILEFYNSMPQTDASLCVMRFQEGKFVSNISLQQRYGSNLARWGLKFSVFKHSGYLLKYSKRRIFLLIESSGLLDEHICPFQSLLWSFVLFFCKNKRSVSDLEYYII